MSTSASRFEDHIERVVGSVRAGESRKDRMREELYAHLEASFEEERRRLGDERSAAEQAIQRLGEVDELTRSLQDSVPRLERILYTPLPSLRFFDAVDRAWLRRDNETHLHHAARITVWMAAAITCAELLLLPVVVATRRTPADWPLILVWAVASIVVIAAGTFVSPLLCEGMIRALQERPGRHFQAVVLGALSSLLVIAGGLGFVGIVALGSRYGILFHQADWPRLLAVALLAPLVVIWAARSIIARRHRQGRWRATGIST
jgi:hypothetical protein